MPLMKPNPVLFTTVRFVPVGGAKFSERFTVLPVAMSPLMVSGTPPPAEKPAFTTLDPFP